MMNELFNYDSSWLNPALKLLIIALFVLVGFVYNRSQRSFAGDIHWVLLILFWMSTVAAVAALLRYFGDGTQFGFSKELSLKWFQSLGYVAQAGLFVVAARKLAKGIIPEVRE
jgi:energy-coupling factor transporter transmembrane protein EcfT